MHNVIGFSSIGPAQVIAQMSERSTSADEIARITIPDENLPGVVEVLLLRCIQQGFLTERLWDMADVIKERKREKCNG